MLQMKETSASTLTEVLNLIDQRCDVNIELKSYEAAVVDLIERFIADKHWSYTNSWFPVLIGMPCSRLPFEFSIRFVY
jgi:hypothetical protein